MLRYTTRLFAMSLVAFLALSARPAKRPKRGSRILTMPRRGTSPRSSCPTTTS